ncbi:MAG: hypothetical protein ACHQX1_02235 [Candidatus Micrarchaeales archaeon]
MKAPEACSRLEVTCPRDIFKYTLIFAARAIEPGKGKYKYYKKKSFSMRHKSVSARPADAPDGRERLIQVRISPELDAKLDRCLALIRKEKSKFPGQRVLSFESKEEFIALVAEAAASDLDDMTNLLATLQGMRLGKREEMKILKEVAKTF